MHATEQDICAHGDIVKDRAEMKKHRDLNEGQPGGSAVAGPFALLARGLLAPMLCFGGGWQAAARRGVCRGADVAGVARDRFYVLEGLEGSSTKLHAQP